MSLKMLDLFSGIGGISLAAEWAGIETVAFCEIEPFCQKVLKKHWPEVEIFDNIKNLSADAIRDRRISTDIDIIAGGFPCQPFSVAGKQRGTKDDRHLWPEMLRIIEEIKPTWVVGENVVGFVDMALDTALFDLETIGYSAQSFVVPACAVNAPHRRDRVFIVANSNGNRINKCLQKSDMEGKLSKNNFKQWDRWPGKTNGHSGWEPEPAICRVDDGVFSELDKCRLKALGNAVVPQQIYPIFAAISAIEGETP